MNWIIHAVPTLIEDLSERLRPLGLLVRGGFSVSHQDGAPEGVLTIVLVGNAGRSMWDAMGDQLRAEADPMNRWTERTLDPIASEFGAAAVYPFGEPPYFPFQRWAQKAEDVYPSPLGILIHPDYGLWHAYRAAFCFQTAIDLPDRENRPSPCDTCEEKPCLSTCPVGAFTVGGGYNVPACAGHLRSGLGRDCMTLGCRARRACPVGQDFTYADGQAAFHMNAFLAARDG